MKSFKIRYALIPICVIIIAVIGVSKTGVFNQNLEPIVDEESRWTIKKVYVDNIDDMIEESIAILPHWEDMTIVQQFPSVEYNSSNYDGKQGEVPEEMIGENLGTVTLTGLDEYTDTTHTKNASLYAINTISQKCAIALQFEGTIQYYPYINAYYRPETLEEFMNDLNLKEIVSFGSVWYNYEYRDKENNLKFDNIEFPDVSDEIIWQMLFSDISLKNVHDDNNIDVMSPQLMSVSVDIPILGYKNISCWVTENGYLVTNILDTGKAFYIGEDKVQEFINYITFNYEGFKTIYIDKNGNEINDIVDEDNKVEDKIVEMENNVVESEVVVTENNITKNVIEEFVGIGNTAY